jgi:hypothetical protein
MTRNIDILNRKTWTDGKVPTLREINTRAYDGSLSIRRHFSNFSIRRQFNENFSFALPCAEAIFGIAKYTNKLIEVGAGTGLWSSLISRAGVDVVATDKIVSTTPYGQGVGKFHPVHRSSAVRAITNNPDRDVLVVWPCYNRRWPYYAAKAIAPGRVLFYIGEGHHGCTADSTFHRYIENFEDIATVDIPQFDGMHDRLFIKRKPRREGAS